MDTELTTNGHKKSTERTQNRHRTDRKTGLSQNRQEHYILHLEHFKDMVRTKVGNGIDVMDMDME